MSRKLVLLDQDLYNLAMERCIADIELGKLAIKIARNIPSAATAVDYVVKMERIRNALEKARDE